jgi:hypothetical protein
MTTINKVRVLGQQDERLRVVGESEDLAPGERIYSARFVGDRGYVVTFRQIDPLFTFDLSDPSAPRKMGELKVPGYSTYIHPIDGDRLLTVGVHVPDGQNRRGGMKISVFDVRDLKNPKEAFTHVIEGSAAWSESVHNHKAFTYLAERRLLALPVHQSLGASSSSDLMLFHIGRTRGIRPAGTLSMSDVRAHAAGYGPGYAPPVRRSIVADDYVYAVSEAGIRAAELDEPEQSVATVQFTSDAAISRR